MLQISLCIFCLRVLPPCFISSPIMLSIPATLFVFSLLIIIQISLYVGGAISLWLSVLSLICCSLSGIIDTLRTFWKYSFRLVNTSSVCEIMLPLVSLQVVGKIVCWGLKVFISWKNFLASFLLWLCSICSIFVIHPCLFLPSNQDICFYSQLLICFLACSYVLLEPFRSCFIFLLYLLSALFLPPFISWDSALCLYNFICCVHYCFFQSFPFFIDDIRIWCVFQFVVQWCSLLFEFTRILYICSVPFC